MKRVSIVIPVYQNQNDLADSIASLLALRDALSNFELELVFVDDGSTDDSYKILTDIQRSDTGLITLVKLTKNFGQGQAIREGVRVATGDCIGIISADLQDPPELFQDMIFHWEAGTKLVIGERVGRDDGPVHRFFSRCYWKLVSRFAIEGFPEGGFDFCLFDKKIKTILDSIDEQNTAIFPLLFWLGFDFEIIKYDRRKRLKGKSQWTLKKRIQLTIDTLIGFTYLPVRIISVSGLVVSLIALGYALFLFVRWWAVGSTVEGWTSLSILVLAIGGLTLISLGVIAEYLWRILEETRRRPSAVIEEIKSNSK